jgi:poly(3-hydroxybutyrate) depolymerase
MRSKTTGLCRTALLIVAGIFGCLFPAAAALADSGDDPAELARTWAAAPVYLPVQEGYRRIDSAELPSELSQRSAAIPAVVYAHGCAGLDAATIETGRFLASAGYLVVAPDSFARLDKPKSCNPAENLGGLHREVLRWRQLEIANAIRKLRTLPNIMPARIFLMGLSEGAITVATFQDEPVRARIIEGWTCHAGWPEYHGLLAPQDEPVLALLAHDDPWWRSPVFQGDCGDFMQGRPSSRSIVYAAPSPLHENHWLSFDPSVRSAILAFLSEWQ